MLKEHIQELLDGSGFAPKVFWGDEELPPQFWQSMTVAVMMGSPCAVVLRRAQEQSEEFWTKLAPVLAMARKSIWPIICLEGDWKAGKPAITKAVSKEKFWPVAQKNRWVWEHPGLSKSTLGAELDRFSAKHGLRFGQGVKQVLVDSLPTVTIALRHELDKILLLAGEDKIIQLTHLDAMSRENPFDLFEFLRFVQTPATRHKAWNRILNDPAMASGDMLFPFSAVLIREARQLWQLAVGEDDKVQLYPRLKDEKKRLATQLGTARISMLWELALRADTDVKTGRLRPAQVLEALVKDVQRLW